MSNSDRDGDVTVGTKPGKRERLVLAASELVHHHGVEKTTLAEIADSADVPLGNVYYYFKTKDALIDAVVDAQVQGIESTLASLGRHRTPKGRLKALIRLLTNHGDVVASYGCPHGTLCSELEKQQNDHATTRLMAIPLAWTEEQFRLMGRRDARELALEFMTSYQGTAVLTHALRDPALLTNEGRRLERWIDSLKASK